MVGLVYSCGEMIYRIFTVTMIQLAFVKDGFS